MPIDSQHPEYTANLPLWTKCRDAVAGQEAIKAGRDKYLPRLSGQTFAVSGGEDAYQAYLARALWFGATDRTLRGYVGAIMRNEPAFDVPDLIKERLCDLDDAGQTAPEFVASITKELLTTGRCGLLVDKNGPDDLPYVKIYAAENIINWLCDEYGVVAVVLKECVFAAQPDDPYDIKEIEQLRELVLLDGTYSVRVYRRRITDDLMSPWEMVSYEQPTRRDVPFTEIPFYFVSSDRDAMSCSKPPILDLANANINHYQLDADYRHGLHFTALPTAVFTGVDDGNVYHLGSEGAITLRNEQAKAFFLEFQGVGMSAVKDAMEERKAQMAALGAQLLQRGQRGRGVETAEAARIQHSGETALLSTIVGRTEESLEHALEFVAYWAGGEAESEVEVSLNRDFIDDALGAEEINALVAAWQAGAVTTEHMFWNFQRGGVVDPRITMDEFTASIAAAAAEKAAKSAAITEQMAKPAPGAPATKPATQQAPPKAEETE